MSNMPYDWRVEAQRIEMRTVASPRKRYTILGAMREFFGEGFDAEWSAMTNAEKIALGRMFRQDMGFSE